MNWEELDNPVWNALWQVHDQYAALFPYVQGYLPAYASFVASTDVSKAANSLEIYSQLNTPFYFVGDKPSLPSSLQIVRELVCDQMIYEIKDHLIPSASLTLLTQQYKEELISLITSCMPEFFKSNTMELGDYYGVFKNGKLIAAAGERMQTNHFIELSGCVTHPDYRNGGYQQSVIAAVVNGILRKGKIPFLHVNENNEHAISLYQKMGFSFRRKLSFWEIQ